MKNQHEVGGQMTTLSEIRKCIEGVETRIKDEIQRTGQSWFSCFRTTSWKMVPTLLNTAQLKGEISVELEEQVLREISNINQEVVDQEKRCGATGIYIEGVPSDEVKRKLLNRLTRTLGIIETPSV